MQTTLVKSAVEASQVIEKEAPVLRSVRRIQELNIGYGMRQGDLYIIRINDTGHTPILMGNGQTFMVNLDQYVSKGEYQLAPGNTTGSRHVITQVDQPHVTMLRNIKEQNPVFGDVIVAKARFTVDHPEHAAHNYPANTYIVGYQLSWKTKMRVND